MPAKTQQLQIRVSPVQKAALKRHAHAAGLDVSSYVLARVLPAARDRIADIVRALADERDRRFAFAELNDFLWACAPGAFGDAVAVVDIGPLDAYLQNYVAAMVEQAAGQKRVPPPAWVREIAPLDAPRFATTLANLRMHLLRSTPVPFKRRNIFVDSAVGDRV